MNDPLTQALSHINDFADDELVDEHADKLGTSESDRTEISNAISRDDTIRFAELTTFHLGGRPRGSLRVHTAAAAAATVRCLDDAGVDLMVVGGGSNLLVTDEDLDFVAVIMDNDALEIDVTTGIVRVGAGAVWDEVVAATVEAGLGGLECLSGIPGSAGATPVQNVGAYGVEIADVLTRVLLLDRSSGQVRWASADELDLAYRYSNLKFTSRAVVLEVEFQLYTDGLSAPLRFGQLSGEAGQRRPASEVRREVVELRRAKGMVVDNSDYDTWSAGSFFTNPVVTAEVADAVAETVAQRRGDEDAARMPRHPVPAPAPAQAPAPGESAPQEFAPSAPPELVKLSAAWLIERAGFAKGYPGPDAAARLSTKHTLALTNRGQAKAADVAALARTVRDGVRDQFGIDLEPEPLWIGLSLEE